MATAKSIQAPRIIEISNSIIRVAHPDISGNVQTALAAPIAAAATAMTIYDNNGFSDDDWMVVGEPGYRTTETTDVNGAVTRGQSLTVTNYLKFGHELDAPVTKIFERGIKIYGAATDGGTGTLIASIDALTASGVQLADAVMIQWEKPYTEFNLISTDTAYAFYYATFTDGTTDSSASSYVPSTGLTYTKIENLVKQSLDITNAVIDNRRLKRSMFVNWANDCQDSIRQFVYQDTTTGRLVQKDWSFEITVDETSIALEEGQDTYALSSLSTAAKYPNSEKSIIAVAVATERPMYKMGIKDFDILRRGVIKTLMNGSAAAAATSITVDSTANFSDSGSLKIGTQTITYTAKTSTTFTGIPASGSGSITATIDDNTPVWQGIDLGLPSRYVIFEGNIIFDRPPSSTYAGITLRVRYFKALTRFTSISDGTTIPFTNVFTTYFSAMVFYRYGNEKMGDKYMGKFEKQVLANAQADTVPQLDEWSYYSYGDDIYDEAVENNWTSTYYDY